MILRSLVMDQVHDDDPQIGLQMCIRDRVIAGQGTIGLEILDQLPDLDAVIVPVGGGGLISGVAFAIKSLRPEVKVYGVQAEGAPSMYRSLHEHKYQTLKAVSTFADGIQVKTPGELTYQICEQYVDDIVTVSEDETAAAILSLMENQKLVAEGAGACLLYTSSRVSMVFSLYFYRSLLCGFSALRAFISGLLCMFRA